MAKAMSAGDYRTKCVIQRAADSVNSIQEPILTWSTHATRYCRLVPSSGFEFVQAMQTTANLRGVIRMRSDTVTRAIKTKDRLQIEGQIYNIEAIYDETALKKEVVIWFRSQDE
jgi:SPP1 family predicted phage head-tail adaptor